MALRVVASRPNTADLYRLDQLIAARATPCGSPMLILLGYPLIFRPFDRRLSMAWMVRLLVPGVPIFILRAISRTGYYPLLEAGIRVFEWNGPMMHAKQPSPTGDGPVLGSIKRSVSWIGNYELDIAVEDEGFAGAMEEMYLEDLTGATEIVLEVTGSALEKSILPRSRDKKNGAQEA